MRKAEYKRMRGVKENYVQDRLRLKRIFCTSIKHVRWMKRYINRAPRHKEKREDENDLIRRGDALKAIRKACISAYLPFDSATPEGQRVMNALYAVWKVQKEGKTHDSI